jgi:hypothetical protein
VRRKTAVILGTGLLAAIAGLQILQLIMVSAANRWAEQGVVIPLYARIFFAIAVFWIEFKWLLALPIIIVFLFLAGLVMRAAK